MALKREAVIRSAEKYVSKGKLEAGIKEYRKVLAENPNDINTLNRVGDLYARIERYDEAVRLFSQIAEQYTRDGFFVKAIAIYKKIIKLDPTALTVYERLAELYHKQGLITEARTQYQVLADYYQKHDNATSAITIYQRMSELEPDNPTFHLKLAELYESQRLSDKAVREYRQLADLMIVNGSVEEAVQVYLKALEIGADNLEFVREAVGGLHESGHTSAAARVLAKAVDLNPDAARISSQVGLDAGPDFGESDDEASVDAMSEPVASAEAGSGPVDPPLEPADSSGFADDAFALDSETSFDFDLEIESDDGVTVQPVHPAADPPATDTPAADASFGDLDDAFADFGSDDSSRVEIDLDPLGETDDAVGIEMNAEDDDEVFTFDLEDDEVPESMVQPPADVTDDTAAGWTADAGVDGQPADDAFEFEIELEDTAGLDATGGLGEVGDLGDDTLAVQEAADAIGSDFASPATGYRADEPARAFDDVPTGDEAIEIDWSSDAMTGLDTDLDSELGGAMDEPVLAEPLSAEPLAADELALEVEPPEVESLDPSGDGLEAFEIELEDPGDATVFAGGAPAFADAPTPPPAPTPPDAQTADETPDEAAGDDEAPAAVRREEDLVAEAKVFAKYGLREKALDRLEELLESYPRHLEGLALRIRLDLEAGRNEDVIERAARLAELSREEGEDEPWATLRQELLDAGFSVDGDQVLAGGESKPVAVAGEDDRIAQLLEDLSLDSFEDGTASLDETAFDSLLDASSTDGASTDAEPAAAESQSSPSPPPPPVAAEADEAPAEEPQEKRRLISLVDELGLDDLDDDLDDEIEVAEGDLAAIAADGGVSGDATLAASPPPPPTMPESLDETGMSWLDDAPVVAEAPSAATETIFDEEDDFFDLAAELEAELGPSGEEIDLQSVSSSMEPQEQSLEEIIEGFKQGVAENLSPEDYDTHFNLGIAYREMGLMDEAIGEFQLASKDPRYLVDSASMLGICFLEKGLPELAVRWYRKALEAPGLTEDGTLGLLYDMGDAYVSMGDADAAYRTFVEIYGMNTNFRDVSARIQDLAPQQT